ncbi:MAG TPA: intradiol ring-cleavage dioxygenase [Methylomirabilota bacterium]|jgi:protocatechuate 3,4-dioxygenase beta subunit
MHDDDLSIGHLLTRRETLGRLGAGGLAALLTLSPLGRGPGEGRASAAAPAACVARPALTEGPYFVDAKLDRSDIRSDPSDGSVKPGAPLRLALRVSRLAAGTCAPLPGALVDVWHCDALGAYSDVSDRGGSTVGRKFLRGYQVTDADGLVRFTTIYPGAYPGRAVHIHFKIRSAAGGGRMHEFTSQLFFDDALTDQVHAQPPYATRGQSRLRNARDSIYRSAGAQLVLAVAPAAPGYAGSFDLALQIG